MSEPQRFLLRAAIAAAITLVVAFGSTAFIAFDANPAHWTGNMRAQAVSLWLLGGGFISLCAGMSAVRS